MAQKQAVLRAKKARLNGNGTPTWDVALLFPTQGSWTEQDFLALEASCEHPRLEFSEGRLEVLPMPTQLHQLIAAYFFKLLEAFVSLHVPGVVLFSGMKIRLGKGKHLRQPDVLYMKQEHATRRHEDYWEGADLVLEVVSPGPTDRKRDLEDKRQEYARAGIPEYWIVDPQSRQVRILTLCGRRYKARVFGPGSVAASVFLPGFALPVDTLLAPPGA